MSSKNVQRFNISEVATFATTAPVAGATWTHLPVKDGVKLDPVQEFDGVQEVNALGGKTIDLPTRKNAKVDLSTRIYTGTNYFGAATDPTSCFAQKLLESYFGVAATTFAGTTVGSSSGAGNAASIVATTTTGLSAGMLVLFAGASGTPEMRAVIEVVDSTHFKTDQDLATAANYAAGAEIIGSFGFSCTLGSYAKQIYALLEKDGHSWLGGPGQVSSLKIGNWSAKDSLEYQMTLMLDTYAAGFAPTSHVDNIGTFTGSPLKGFAAPVNMAGTDLEMVSFDIDFGVNKQEIVGVGGNNGRSGYENVASRPSGSFKPFYSATQRTRMETPTAVAIRAYTKLGSSKATMGAGGLGIYVPQAQVKFPDDSDSTNDQLTMNGTWESVLPTVAQQATGLNKMVYLGVFGGI